MAALVVLTASPADSLAVRAATVPVDGVSVGVRGNQLVDGAGHPVRLVGVDRSGTEYACVQGWGIFDGPSDAASVAAMASWDIDAVRVPLNEDCWLGINGVPPAYGGAAYRRAIAGYVHELNRAGLVAIVDLHWGAPGSTPATGQEEMPDTHALAFWRSVGRTFGTDRGVVLDLFNEPHTVGWSCWLHGCTLPGGARAVGMQQLVDTVRSVGATQPVMVEPLDYGSDLSGWLAHEPVDPDHALVASVHVYDTSGCNTPSCWSGVIGPVAARVPVVTGELGELDCASGFTTSYTDWADTAGGSYLAWAWDAGGGWSCTDGPSLITDYTGDPDAYGAGYEAHLAGLAVVRTQASLSQSWGDGGVVTLAVTNTGTEPVGTVTDPWSVRFALDGDRITSMWDARLTADADGVVTAVAPASTPSLAPGQTIDVGWAQDGNLDLPTEIDLDGAATAPQA